IDETLKKMAAGTSKASTPTSSSISDLPGDPNCKYCGGLGYVGRDVPLGHPDFGKAFVCVCRRADVMRAVRERLFSLSHLDELQGLTFESFQPHGQINLGKSHANLLEQAYNIARQYAASLKGWLLLQGGFGCGKTHLAAAIANFAVSMGVPTLFLTVPDMLDLLRFSFDSEDTTFEQRFDEIRNAPLLVLDDFGTQSATAWAQEKLFQIVNYRYVNKLPLVVTTNVPLDDIEERIRSRIQDPELVSKVIITAPDYRHPLDDKGHHELSSLDLHANKTFVNFDDRGEEGLSPDKLNSLEKALKAATDFARKPKGWLVITGPYGCGKTHLAAAIANARTDLGDQPLFVMVPDLLDHLRATFNEKSNVRYDRRFDNIRTSPLLILDDLGTQSMTPWAREKLHQLFNYRYNAELPTVITTADTLEEMDARIRSRMLDGRLCTIYAITAPAFHGGKARKTKR
ncbi:MAG TPA: ATP-binding protein, partial [Anaerolineales bacterium]